MLLEWTEELAVGHKILDEQHKEIFSRYRAFLAGCDRGRTEEQLRELFEFLDRYIEEHITLEESIMEEVGYPGLEEQRADHRYFRDRLDELKAMLAEGGEEIPVLIRTNKALVYWLTDHIRKDDVAFGRFLRERAAGKPNA